MPAETHVSPQHEKHGAAKEGWRVFLRDRPMGYCSRNLPQSRSKHGAGAISGGNYNKKTGARDTPLCEQVKQRARFRGEAGTYLASLFL